VGNIMHKFSNTIAFDIESKYDPNLLDITFMNINDDETMMQITCISAQAARKLEGKIIALRRIYEMDTPAKQNFTIKYNEKDQSLKIIGNLANVLNLLKENELISENLSKTITNTKNIQHFISSPQAVKFSSDKQSENQSDYTEESTFSTLL
jgi:hypothetical protein